MNQTMGAGDETNGRPLLGGLGSPFDSSSARSGTGLPYSALSEAFARTSNFVYTLINNYSSERSDYLGDDNSAANENARTRVR